MPPVSSLQLLNCGSTPGHHHSQCYYLEINGAENPHCYYYYYYFFKIDWLPIVWEHGFFITTFITDFIMYCRQTSIICIFTSRYIYVLQVYDLPLHKCFALQCLIIFQEIIIYMFCFIFLFPGWLPQYSLLLPSGVFTESVLFMLTLGFWCCDSHWLVFLQTLAAVKRLCPKQALLIGMTHEFDHHKDNEFLAEWSRR